jgi:8-oxo-dGTP pyrophosphatase MutT (NUDIX family)
MQQSARAILLTSDGLVLLMQFRAERGRLWITPGGRIRPGEEAAAAVRREILEETGRDVGEVGNQVWVRRGRYLADGSWREEQEHFFLVLVEKFEPATARMEAEELALHQGFRWWSIEEIARSAEVFVPRRMAELLRALRDDGSPPSPIDVTDG